MPENRARRPAGVDAEFRTGDAHALPLGDRSVDAAVCLRVIMHTPDWSRVISELCRVSRDRVIVDFPTSVSFAALESAWRRRQARQGRAVEAYRVFSVRDVTAAVESQGFRVAAVRRQFVLPINLHKKMGSLRLTHVTEGVFRAAGLLAAFGSPATLVAHR